MRCLKRFIAAILSFILACSTYVSYLPTIVMAADSVSLIQSSASITLVVNFDLPQSLDNVKKRNIKLKLTKGAESATFSLNTGEKMGTGFQDVRTAVTAKNKNGVEMTTESVVGSYDITISDLETGNYTLELTGEGCAPFKENVQLNDYSLHMVVSTSNGTFSLGDVNNDGVVNVSDRTALVEELGQKNDTVIYDLDGDGMIDVSDLAYVNRTMDVDGNASKYETAAIVSASIETEKLNIEGQMENLFNGKNDITFSNTDGEDILIPIVFNHTSVEMSQIVLTSPTGTGALVAGTAILELENGAIEEYEFDSQAPQGFFAISRSAGKNTIAINLGKKVAVKKVTIKVKKVIGQDGKPEYVTLTQIQFLKDVILDDAQNVDSKVKGIVATPGDKSVSLEWNPVSNVTGYMIQYGTKETDLSQNVVSNTNNVVVTGLENLTKYYFQITAINGDWRGTPSDIISAIPEAGSIPGAPSNISVTPANQSLRISWGKTKDASYYQVFYRKQNDTEWMQFGNDTEATSMTITGLVNNVTYEVAVKAGNSKGVGPYSSVALGTPESEELEQPNFPTEGRIDNSEITSITMADPTNFDKSFCPDFITDHFIDGDANTYWVARDWFLNAGITFTFKEPHDMNYLLFAPYLNKTTNHRTSIANYTVTIKDATGKETKHSFATGRLPLTEDNYMIVTFPEVENVESVTIALGQVAGGSRVSISEIAFYNSEKISSGIANLFADNAFTTLKSTVTQQNIQQLSDQLEQMGNFYLDVDLLKDELTLAQTLLNNSENITSIIKNDFQSRSGSADGSYGQTASALQPIGISALANSKVAIYAEIPEGETVSIVPTQYYGESGIWSEQAITLQNGRNYISIPKIGSLTDTRGGMLYLTYGGNQPEKIKLHVRENEKAFKIPVLELSNWYRMTETDRRAKIQTYTEELQAHVAKYGSSKTDIKNATEVSTPSVLLSLPADQILAGLKGINNDMVETMYQNVLAWEEVLFVANKVQGIIEANTSFDTYQYPMTTRQNIRYMRMFAGAFMYAAGNHVGIEYGSASALACGKPTSSGTPSLFGWGIAHEIGHNMDKLGKAEITNNIYSIAIQAWNGSDMVTNTRLTNSNKWQSIYKKVALGHPGAASDVFTQLGMYWQLHLAYDDANNPLGFYNEFFKKWKSGSYSGTYDEKVAKIASEVTGKDLTEFFNRWGMNVTSNGAEESRAIWYLNDESYKLRLEGANASPGTSTLTTSVNGNEVTLTIENSGSSNLLGHEILRNGNPIGFTTENTYIDSLGAANNLTYTYAVVPVDKLGNMGAKVETTQIRIAYDKTISDSLYTVSTEGGNTIITMNGNEPIPVTGIKANTDGTASIRVSKVKNPSASDWVTVKGESNFSANTPFYFNKPGAPVEDTRIWTYDVSVMEIQNYTGTVELLDYPGDRVDFYGQGDKSVVINNASVGKLASDYSYSDTESIPAGTVVIVGTYRGNPGYNIVQIEGRYNTTSTVEEEESQQIEHDMNGYSLLFSEIPEDGAVSDTSDGFFLFVPDLEAEIAELGDDLPVEIRAIMYRTDDPEDASSKRKTSETLWISFPIDNKVASDHDGEVPEDVAAKIEKLKENITTITFESNVNSDYSYQSAEDATLSTIFYTDEVEKEEETEVESNDVNSQSVETMNDTTSENSQTEEEKISEGEKETEEMSDKESDQQEVEKTSE